MRIVLVLEYCKDNLRSYISKNQELIPGKSATKHKAIRIACQWVKEITDALAYIHDVQRIVHRDLKLENILVRCKFVVFGSSVLPSRPSSGKRYLHDILQSLGVVSMTTIQICYFLDKNYIIK